MVYRRVAYSSTPQQPRYTTRVTSSALVAVIVPHKIRRRPLADIVLMHKAVDGGFFARTSRGKYTPRSSICFFKLPSNDGTHCTVRTFAIRLRHLVVVAFLLILILCQGIAEGHHAVNHSLEEDLHLVAVSPQGQAEGLLPSTDGTTQRKVNTTQSRQKDT